MVQEIQPKPDLVSALHPTGIRIESVGLIVTRRGIPSFCIAEGGVVSEAERRQTAFERIRPIGARYSERVPSEIGAEIGWLHILAEAGPAQRPIDEESGGHGIGLSDAGGLHERMAIADAAVAQTGTTGCAQPEVPVNQRVHHAVLEEQLLLPPTVPIDLGVQVVAIQALCAAVEEIIDISAEIGLRNQRQQFRGGRAQARGGNHIEASVTRKYGPASAAVGAGGGIEDHSLAKLGNTSFGGVHHNRIASGV